ncbi:hypothetical protein [Acanthopleuribacter pedis]|uniref:[acyl-carrier-protein] S-malonyltransferase n=1 Tax=Acanthopleuribacter pedis TaxID=442870 RepID=A0A8J7Q9V8_9BACT|nr:hypothetical protein [Acanthopleuribacter pedis]MBO1320427.1 hypothetical protein [Acanthopleuribacter pedis]
MARLVLVAPGRGSYNRTELGYFKRFRDHAAFARRGELLAEADALRAAAGRPSLAELDTAANFSSARHLPGENASGLIFTASAADHALLNTDEHQICAVLGNSMGWYTALYLAGALSFGDAFRVVDTMASYQKGNIRGGQIIYPLVDDAWRIQPEREQEVAAALAAVNAEGEDYWVGLSIRLGGFLVLAGTDLGLKKLTAKLPAVKLGSNDYPFALARHSAFHTPLMDEASARGMEDNAGIKWRQPKVPLIDGRGHQWLPGICDAGDIHRYTFGHQVVAPFDFTAAVRVALREYNPDYLVLLGPGETLGGSMAHTMIAEGWRGIHARTDFTTRQKSEQPLLVAMNRPDQARLVI